MKITLYNILTLSALLVLFSLTGCTRRDLLEYPDKIPFKIVLDWGTYAKPSATGYFLYDHKGSAPLYLEGTTDGFEGHVPSATYRIAIFNTDPVNARLQSAGNFEEDCFVAHQLQSRNTVGVISSVRNVYGTSVTGVVVPQNTNKQVVVRARPVELVRRVSYTINISSIGGIASLELFQGGAIIDKRIANNKPLTGNAAALHEKATLDKDRNLFLAELSAFDFVGPCELTAIATFEDGTTATSVPIDLTEDLIKYSEEDVTINIVLELEDYGEIQAAVKVHGWKTGGGGGTIIQ